MVLTKLIPCTSGVFSTHVFITQLCKRETISILSNQFKLPMIRFLKTPNIRSLFWRTSFGSSNAETGGFLCLSHHPVAIRLYFLDHFLHSLPFSPFPLWPMAFFKNTLPLIFRLINLMYSKTFISKPCPAHPCVCSPWMDGKREVSQKEGVWESLKLIKWSYSRRFNIKASFDSFPHSTVLFRKIKGYYFVYNVYWSPQDPVVTREDLVLMELLLNRELGSEREYINRQS